jgi:hypothetical protein
MFRLTRPSPATRAAAAIGMVGAVGPVISCFPHELQYRVPELNGLPQPSQYMFLPPLSLATDQYYVPRLKMFQAPARYTIPNLQRPPAVASQSLHVMPSEVSLLRHVIFESERQAIPWPIITIACDR